MKLIHTLILLLTIVSCGTKHVLQEVDVIGHYEWKSSIARMESIELFENDSFLFSWSAGLMTGNTMGVWRISGRNIVLLSNEQPDSKAKIKILDVSEKYGKPLKIFLVDEDNEKVMFSTCSLKKDSLILQETSSDINGEAYLIRDIQADSLIITQLGYKDVRIPYDNKVSLMEIRVQSAQQYKYFTNQKWRFKRDKLFDPSKRNKDLTGKYYFKKINKNALQQSLK
jgi:hypothetical protein